MISLEAVANVLPVLLLVGLGVLIRRQSLIRATTIDDLRHLVLNIALPAALFLAFLRTNIEVQYAVIVALVFAATTLVFLAFLTVARGASIGPAAAPGLISGFEGGMLGFAIFGAVFGRDELYRYGVVDLGQEPFIYFILATWLARRGSAEAPRLAAAVAGFVRTPVVMSIAAGVLGSALGLGQALDASPIGAGVLQAVALVGGLTTPLIAIVVGYSTRLRRGSLGAPVAIIAARLAIWVPLALIFNVVVIDTLLGLDRLWQAAVMTMAILPPPFVVPLFMRNAVAAPDDAGAEGAAEEQEYVMNALSVGTLVTLGACVAVAIAYAP